MCTDPNRKFWLLRIPIHLQSTNNNISGSLTVGPLQLPLSDQPIHGSISGTQAPQKISSNFHQNKDSIYLPMNIGTRFASDKLLVIPFLSH